LQQTGDHLGHRVFVLIRPHGRGDPRGSVTRTCQFK
jgi:hypothetical protein